MTGFLRHLYHTKFSETSGHNFLQLFITHNVFVSLGVRKVDGCKHIKIFS